MGAGCGVVWEWVAEWWLMIEGSGCGVISRSDLGWKIRQVGQMWRCVAGLYVEVAWIVWKVPWLEA